MKLKIRYDDRVQTIELDEKSSSELWISLSIDDAGCSSSEEKEKRLQETFDNQFNKPEYNNMHKETRHISSIPSDFDDRCDVDGGGLSMSHVMDKSIFYNDMMMIDRQDEYEDVCRKVYKILGRKKHWSDASVAIRLDNMSVNDYSALIGKNDASIISKWLKRAEEKLRKYYR